MRWLGKRPIGGGGQVFVVKCQVLSICFQYPSKMYGIEMGLLDKPRRVWSIGLTRFCGEVPVSVVAS